MPAPLSQTSSGAALVRNSSGQDVLGNILFTQPASPATLALVAGTVVTGPAATGTLATLAGTETLTNKTITGALDGDIKFCSTQFDAVTGTTGTTLTNVVGLTGFSLVAAGVYQFDIHIAGVSTANCGIKIGLGYTTLTATSIESMAQGFTASAVACQHTTTATTGMTLYGQTAAVLAVRISGQLVVNAAGTVAVQAAQNAAHTDTTSVYVGAWARFRRVS